MNQLQVINQDGQLLVDSRQVAGMVDKEHKHLLRDIKGYVEILVKSNFGLCDFFIESTYTSLKNRQLPCYLITRKGCDMVANKMTGEKGILFTAEYVTRFNEMEQHLRLEIPTLSPNEAVAIALQQTAEMMTKVPKLESRIETVEQKVDTQITLDSGEQRQLQKAVNAKVYSIESARKLRGRLFQQLHREIKDRWGVPSYKDVRRQDLQSALRYIDAWVPKREAN